MTYLYVAIGGGLGSMARLWLAQAVARLTGPGMPWGTILINVTGSGLIGALAALVLTRRTQEISPQLAAFLITGFCGGYTTFSSFSLQSLELIQKGRTDLAAANIALSVSACLAAVAAGYAAVAGYRS